MRFVNYFLIKISADFKKYIKLAAPMKKLHILVFSVLLFNFCTNAQEGSVFTSFHIGNTFSFWKSDAVPVNTTRTILGQKNWLGGVMVSFMFTDNLSISGGASLASHQFQVDDLCTTCLPQIESTSQFDVKRFQVPLQLEWYFWKNEKLKTFFQAGAYVGIIHDARLQLSDSNNSLISEEDAQDEFNIFVPGYRVGAGVYKVLTQRLDLGGIVALNGDFIPLHQPTETYFRGTLIQVKLNYRF